jgi:hypothetical protein
LFVELFLTAERAEDRVFKKTLEVPELIERRGRILSALWSLVLAWDGAGRPVPSRGNSSFPQWANIIGGIVENAGFQCPLESPHIEAAADVDGDDMRALVEVLVPLNKPEITESRQDFAQIVSVCKEHGLFERFIPKDEEELDRRNKAAFSHLLKGYHHRLIGRCRFTVDGKGHSRTYLLEQMTAHGDMVSTVVPGVLKPA